MCMYLTYIARCMGRELFAEQLLIRRLHLCKDGYSQQSTRGHIHVPV